jgi:hypothetical protein
VPRGVLRFDQVLASPYFLIGQQELNRGASPALREQYGIGYFTFLPDDLEAFAPILAHLVGTSNPTAP